MNYWTIFTLNLAAAINFRLIEGLKLQRKNFVVLHKWTNLNFSFPTEEDRQRAIVEDFFEENQTLPVDLDVEYGDDGYHRTFLAVPRLGRGVPYSLAVILDHDNRTVLNPQIGAYPNYSWHSSNGADCKGITSAIRLFIDECWRLWVIDSGQINSVQICSPKILAFDLVSDTLVHQYTIPETLYISGVSVFSAAIADVGNIGTKLDCRDTKVYLADTWGYGLIVYNAFTRRSWRIEHDLMHPDQKARRQNPATDGIFTVSLSPKWIIKGKRLLYFHSLSSSNEISVPLDVVNNETLWEGNSPAISADFKITGDRGTQCESEVMDSAGNLYCSLLEYNSIVTWKHETKYNSNSLRVVAFNPQQLQFITGLKINKNAQEEDELWALSSNPKVFFGEFSKSNAIKFQVVGCRTTDLLNNRYCTVAAKKGTQNNY